MYIYACAHTLTHTHTCACVFVCTYILVCEVLEEIDHYICSQVFVMIIVLGICTMEDDTLFRYC